MGDIWRDIASGYRIHIVEAGKEQSFWILITFLLTFLIVRLITLSIRRGSRIFRNMRVGETHFHHLVPGIFLVLVTGYLATAVHARAGQTTIAIFFGIGAALTLDEFALWLHLKDVYWQKEGRRSIDVVIIAATIIGLSVLGLGFWRDVGHAIGRRF